MGNPNEPLSDDRFTSFKIVIEQEDIAFSSARPIVGVLEVECKESVPAYGIEIALIQNDYSHSTTKRTRNKRTETVHYTGNQN